MDLSQINASPARSLDFNFREENFNIMLSKLIDVCLGFDRRKLGPSGMKAFEIAEATPDEFKEILKRTFNMRLNAAELGALVKYFDHTGSGSCVVSCPKFLKDFNQMRLRLERFKGKPNETESIKEMHHQLKESYIQRIEKISVAEGRIPRPWVKGSIMAPKKIVRVRRSPPENAMQKLKRRLLAGKQSGRMDLSTSYLLVCSYRDTEKKSATPLQVDEIPQIDVGEEVHRDQTVDDEPTVASRPVTGDSVPISDGFTIAGDGNFFILTAIPDQVYKYAHLTELWLCNNNLKTCSDNIGSLSSLKLLSLQGCDLKDLSSAIGDIHGLETLYLQNNNLETLPSNFCNLIALKELDLSFNIFKTVPESVYQMSAISLLNFSNNYLDILSNRLQNLRSLLILNIEGNNFDEKKLQIVLNKMHWISVIGYSIPKSPLAASVFVIHEEEEKTMAGIIRQRARRRAEIVAVKKKNITTASSKSA